MNHRIHTESDLDTAIASLVQADPRFAGALAKTRIRHSRLAEMPPDEP